MWHEGRKYTKEGSFTEEDRGSGGSILRRDTTDNQKHIFGRTHEQVWVINTGEIEKCFRMWRKLCIPITTMVETNILLITIIIISELNEKNNNKNNNNDDDDGNRLLFYKAKFCLRNKYDSSINRTKSRCGQDYVSAAIEYNSKQVNYFHRPIWLIFTRFIKCNSY